MKGCSPIARCSPHPDPMASQARRQTKFMERKPRCQFTRADGYLMIECLVYIGMVFVLLGVASVALYRCIDRSVVLRRNADDIASALHAGERWRSDLRSANGGVRLETDSRGEIVHIPSKRGEVTYLYSENTLARRLADGGWITILSNLKSSKMQAEPRRKVTAWRWEIELEPRAKASANASKIRPLFTFMAVPGELTP